MKAMLLNAPKPVESSPLEFTDIPKPRPKKGEIRLKVSACGVCHTDLHTVEGELSLPKLPLVPGHEVVGYVDALGDGAKRFKKGDRVGAFWLYSSCGKCKFCKRGQENLCENGKFTGLHEDGGYEEYMIADENFIYKIPDNFSDENAAPLLCAGIIGYRSFVLSEVKPGERLGLFGFGASAHIVIQIALHEGCEVYVFSRSEEHRSLARKLGASWTGSATDDPPKKIDAAITFAPAGWIVKEGLRVMEKGGTLAINAIYMSPIPELDYRLIYHERKVRSVANETRKDAEELLKLAGEIPIKTEVETFDLERANHALNLLKHGKINGAGVLKLD